MSQPILNKYIDGAGGRFADVTLASGERVLLSLVKSGFALLRLHLGGYLPGRRLFAVNADDLARMARVLAREADRLPPLPRAVKVHRDGAQMNAFLDAAILDLKAVGEGKPVPGAVDALDLDAFPEQPLSLLTRAALAARDAEDCVRLFTRAKNTPG